MFTVANWLLADPEDEGALLKFQPVAKEPDNDTWTDDFDMCACWLRSGEERRLL